MIDPRKAALIIIDMQHGFLDSSSAASMFANRGDRPMRGRWCSIGLLCCKYNGNA